MLQKIIENNFLSTFNEGCYNSPAADALVGRFAPPYTINDLLGFKFIIYFEKSLKKYVNNDKIVGILKRGFFYQKMTKKISNEISLKNSKINNEFLLKRLAFACILVVMVLGFLSCELGGNFEGKVYGATTSSSNSSKDEREVELSLKSLSVDGFELYPEFNENTTTYYVAIPATQKSLDVSYEANVESAKVTVTGNTSLTKTENLIKVSLSKSGYTSRTYKIYATKQVTDGPKLSSLSINGVELSPEFSKDVFYYTADVKYSNELAPLEITAIPESESTKVEILGNTLNELKDGDNNIISIVLTGTKNVTVYQINVTFQKSSMIVVTNSDSGNVSKVSFDFKGKAKKLWGKIVDFYNENQIPVLAGIGVIIIVILLIIINKNHNNKVKQNRKKMKDRV